MVAGTPVPQSSPPSVTLDDAIFTGTTNGSVSAFLGIPYVQPPVGDLRFHLPQAISPYNGTYNASAYGPSCPQQTVTVPGNLTAETEAILTALAADGGAQSEDCLTINVYTPASATTNSKLPVVVVRGFAVGGASTYPGDVIVNRSLALNEPVIYKVAKRSTCLGFGFLAGKEVMDAGVANFERQALRWVQQYISSFGGDPSKVTIWGQSAGSTSIVYHMITNGGDNEGLFRGAYMNSGSQLPVSGMKGGQPYYDTMVKDTGCSNSSDTLQCLREAPYGTLKSAIDNVPTFYDYQAPILPWMPRPDGVFLVDNPQTLIKEGSVANVSFVNGDCDDEATPFSYASLNITTEQELRVYITTYWSPHVSNSTLDKVMELYPVTPADGSPFNTGNNNTVTPQFKRVAAFLGDINFQGPRRFLLQARSGHRKIWSFLSKRMKDTPGFGAFHGSDIDIIYGSADMTDYLIRFVANLDPSGNTGINWPQYKNETPNLLTFLDGSIPANITQDTYRKEGIELVTRMMLDDPWQ
ncbi:hypothetical protein SERLA73DRAFT_126278 [Serpula lacrymans var. lacrymans S7.3]|uniref:Carboxylic ester hydrolase n=2 Tax=Serpula lacrymans var. lacrymans TaxID=341189 RepID=F8QCJ3_SERL3|nr:uncharacterized protein SERLADRAFT_374500 [Serpula lacrymans var. lacrymans S7.9]EGN93858.1 hypothetical protein SERLA73DRAFT_126278 [Serpula lacrymans var. lacrymans S7.3]EGO19225.1 hypothetical protein SERLADRAFT_374500 [Serpula lacrymans var. lacrymans S7.9]